MAIVLVSGGAGFIGSHLVETLLERGDTVRVFDNFSTGSRANLAAFAGQIEVIEGDLRSREQVAQAVQGVQYIFHQAAFVSVPLSLEDPQACFDVNVSGTWNLLEAARQAEVRRVVLASSAAVYGDAETMPLTEDAPLRSLSPYAASKRITETFADLYTNVFGLPVVALRYFNVYGPRQSPQSHYAAAIPIFIRRLLDNQPPVVLGDGGQSRDFVFVRDVARANLLAAEAPGAPGRAFNVCTGAEISLLDLLDGMAEIIPGAPPPQFAAPRPGDIYRSLGSPAQAQAVLGFQAQTSLIEGLAQTILWMRA